MLRLPTTFGLNKIKTELEDLSFRYEHPEEYAQIEAKLQETQAEREEVFVNLRLLSVSDWTKWASVTD